MQSCMRLRATQATCSHLCPPLHAALLVVLTRQNSRVVLLLAAISRNHSQAAPCLILANPELFFNFLGQVAPNHPKQVLDVFPACFQGSRKAELTRGSRCSYLGSLPVPGTTLQLAPSCSELLPSIAACRCRGTGIRQGRAV